MNNIGIYLGYTLLGYEELNESNTIIVNTKTYIDIRYKMDYGTTEPRITNIDIHIIECNSNTNYILNIPNSPPI